MKKEDVQKIQEVVRNVTRFAREHRTKIYITKLSNGNLVYDIGLEGIGTGTIDSLLWILIYPISIRHCKRKECKRNQSTMKSG